MVKKRGSCDPGSRSNVIHLRGSVINPNTQCHKYLKVCFVNARSLRNKFSDLESLALTEDYDIIGITETWINTEVRDYLAEYALQGYSLFNNERKDKTGGGVLMYVKTILGPTLITNTEIKNIDSVYVQIKTKSHDKLTLALTYRPPAQSSVTDAKLYDQIADISCQGDAVFFGDFNLPVTKWGGTLTSHTGIGLYRNLQESSLCQLVENPTRGANILDLLFTTDDNLINNVEVGEEFSSSDHRIVTFELKFNSDNENSSFEKIPDYKKANFHKLKHTIENIDWSNISSSTDINDAWKVFTSLYNTAVNSCIPMKNRRPIRNSKPKWWNNEIKLCLTAKKIAHQKFKLTASQNDKTDYENQRRKSKKLIKQSKRSLESRIAINSKTNPKEFYGYIRKKKTIAPTIGPLKNEKGESTRDETKMAKLLNNFFASVFTVENIDSIPPISPLQIDSENTLCNIVFHEGDVLHVINKTKTNKTPGPDKIAPKILKEVNNGIVKPLTDCFNKSINMGKVPQEWKLANVTPIFKKGSKSSPGNYRPISLTSIVCKLMETIIRDKIVKHLEENNLLNDSQHGFRSKRSCLTNLLDFFYDIFKMYDEEKAVDVVYLDFQKAFDKVPHKRLLAKIKAHGIDGKVLSWLENWLSERKQRVVINGKTSEWLNVTSGVPQGSVLGPVLFLIYINDIDNDLCCKISKFADDTKIGNKATSHLQRQQIQNDLDKLVEWSERWQMNFNIDKCKVLHLGNKNTKAQYTMNGTPINAVDKEKDLGVVITSDLKPGVQCAEAIKKANQIVGFIGRSFEFKSEKIILTLYNALVRPHLEYCVQFWSPYYRKDIDKLERIQRRVTKMIPRLRNKPYEERLKELNLFNLTKRRLRGDLIQVFKMFKGHDNLDINKYFTLDQSNFTRNNGYKLIGQPFVSFESKHFFFNRVVNVWNQLPREIVNCSTILTFKNRLDIYFNTNPRLDLFTRE